MYNSRVQRLTESARLVGASYSSERSRVNVSQTCCKPDDSGAFGSIFQSAAITNLRPQRGVRVVICRRYCMFRSYRSSSAKFFEVGTCISVETYVSVSCPLHGIMNICASTTSIVDPRHEANRIHSHIHALKTHLHATVHGSVSL